jgi:hypothetical protein
MKPRVITGLPQRRTQTHDMLRKFFPVLDREESTDGQGLIGSKCSV